MTLGTSGGHLNNHLLTICLQNNRESLTSEKVKQMTM